MDNGQVNFFEYYSYRCPQCDGTRITSDNNRNHRCLDCGKTFTDAEATPSLARQDAMKEKA